jgi:hemoglobin-like flavoprotein
MVAANADTLPELFFERLFALDPSLRQLFKHDAVKQGRMLMQMLTIAIYSLRDPESITPLLQQLGHRYASYGIGKSHYDIFRDALICALAQSMGSSFTVEMKEAWESVYESLVGIATEGVYSEIFSGTQV